MHRIQLLEKISSTGRIEATQLVASMEPTSKIDQHARYTTHCHVGLAPRSWLCDDGDNLAIAQYPVASYGIDLLAGRNKLGVILRSYLDQLRRNELLEAGRL
jgi:hypothetical protein